MSTNTPTSAPTVKQVIPLDSIIVPFVIILFIVVLIAICSQKIHNNKEFKNHQKIINKLNNQNNRN